jgi:hypothetical protein
LCFRYLEFELTTFDQFFGKRRVGKSEPLKKVDGLVVLLFGRAEVLDCRQEYRQIVVVLREFQSILPIVWLPSVQRLGQTDRLLVELLSGGCVGVAD